MKSFLLNCFSILVIIITVKEATQNPVLLPFGSTPKVWELFYQHVGAGPVLDVEAGDYASVTCEDMMLRAPEDSEVSMRISGYAATSKVRLHHHWQARYLPMVMFFLQQKKLIRDNPLRYWVRKYFKFAFKFASAREDFWTGKCGKIETKRT